MHSSTCNGKIAIFNPENWSIGVVYSLILFPLPRIKKIGSNFPYLVQLLGVRTFGLHWKLWYLAEDWSFYIKAIYSCQLVLSVSKSSSLLRCSFAIELKQLQRNWQQIPAALAASSLGRLGFMKASGLTSQLLVWRVACISESVYHYQASSVYTHTSYPNSNTLNIKSRYMYETTMKQFLINWTLEAKDVENREMHCIHW